MKYLIISDIHGGSYYLKEVLDLVKDFDKLILLGDILYHGPRNKLPEGYNPMEVVKLLTPIKEKIICIRGNCDAKIDLEILPFKIVDHYWIKLNGHQFYLTHGDEYNKDHLPSKLKKYYLLYGHEHKNLVYQINNRIVAINLGSISLPKDNHHCYALIEDNTLTSYDLISKEVIFSLDLK